MQTTVTTIYCDHCRAEVGFHYYRVSLPCVVEASRNFDLCETCIAEIMKFLNYKGYYKHA